MRRSKFKYFIVLIVGFLLGMFFTPVLARAQASDYNPTNDVFPWIQTYNIWYVSGSGSASRNINSSNLEYFSLNNHTWKYFFDTTVYGNDPSYSQVPTQTESLTAQEPLSVFIITDNSSSFSPLRLYLVREVGGPVVLELSSVDTKPLEDTFGNPFYIHQYTGALASGEGGLYKLRSVGGSAFINRQIYLYQQFYGWDENTKPDWWQYDLIEDVLDGIKNPGSPDPSGTGGYSPRAEGSIFSQPTDLQLFSSISGKNDEPIPLMYHLYYGSDSLDYNIQLTIQKYNPVINKWVCPPELTGWFVNECNYIINNIKTTDGKYVINLPNFIDEEILSDGSYRIRAELWTTTWYSAVYRNLINTISVYFNVGVNTYQNETGREKPVASDPLAWVGNIFGDDDDDNPCGANIVCQTGLALERIFIPSPSQWIEMQNAFVGIYELLQQKFPFSMVFGTLDVLSSVVFVSTSDYYPKISFPFPLNPSESITILDTANFRVSDGGYFPDAVFNAMRLLMGFSVYWVFIWYTFSRVMRIIDNNNDDIVSVGTGTIPSRLRTHVRK